VFGALLFKGQSAGRDAPLDLIFFLPARDAAILNETRIAGSSLTVRAKRQGAWFA
jgi:hypothetical protein